MDKLWFIAGGKEPLSARFGFEVYQSYAWAGNFNGLVNGATVEQKIRDLSLPKGIHSDNTLEEVFDLVYSERRKDPLNCSVLVLLKMTSYLNETGFQNNEYDLREFVNLFDLPNHRTVPQIHFGYISTEPCIAEFAQIFCFQNDGEAIRNLDTNDKKVVDALKYGGSYGIIRGILHTEAAGWILGFPQLIAENVDIVKLLIDFSGAYSRITFDLFHPLINDVENKRLLMLLSRLSDRGAAMAKLFLMVYYHDSSQLICGSDDPFSSFQALVISKISDWRLRKDVDLKKIYAWFLRLDIRFSSIENYYEGYRENFLFDVIINSGFSVPFNVLEAPEIPSLGEYNLMVIKNEFQGTVYAILQEKCGLVGPINPLSDRIENDFEEQIIIAYSLKWGIHQIWTRLQFLQLISEIPFSRLIYYQYFKVDDLFLNFFMAKSDDIVLEKIDELISSIASALCLPEGRSLEIKTGIPTNLDEVDSLFRGIWTEIPRTCFNSRNLEVIDKRPSETSDLITRLMFLSTPKTAFPTVYYCAGVLGSAKLEINGHSLNEYLESLSRSYTKAHGRTLVELPVAVVLIVILAIFLREMIKF